MSRHKHYYENDEDLKNAYNDAVNSGGYKQKWDEDGTLIHGSLEDFKYETGRYSRNDLDWSGSHEDMYEKGKDDNDVYDDEHDVD